jgi:hypothetical protein
MGAPFGASATVASDGTPSDRSGPDPANGDTIIEAANLHDAVVIAKGCPGLGGDGSVKLYEAMPMAWRRRELGRSSPSLTQAALARLSLRVLTWESRRSPATRTCLGAARAVLPARSNEVGLASRATSALDGR